MSVETSTKTYKDAHRLRDGKILVYKREGSDAYQTRLNVDGIKGYIFKTTKKKQLPSAMQVAEDMYDDYRFKVRNNLDVGTYTFATLYKKWWEVVGKTLSIHRQTYIQGTANRYLLPYFGKKSIDTLSDAYIEQYWDWRINYRSSREGQERIEKAKSSRTTKNRPYKTSLGNVSKIPAKKTLQMEQSVLRQIFHWAKRTGRVVNVPHIQIPRIKQSQNADIRPAFELEEWRLLVRFMRNWVKEEYDQSQPRKNGSFVKSKDDKIKRPHSLHRFQREMIRNYVQFMGYSGLRPNEARQLRWCDVDFGFLDRDGKRQVLIQVSPTTKTGARSVVPVWYAKRPLERIRKLSNHTNPTDLVFCDDREGNPIKNFGKTFKDILRKSGLLEDRFGKVRTIYSLRHTYATFRLLYTDISMEVLATNMGTSPMIIFRHYRHITSQQQAHILGTSGTTR